MARTFTPHNPRRHKNYERFTLSHNAMLRAGSHWENGLPLDGLYSLATPSTGVLNNSGPHVIDYNAMFTTRPPAGSWATATMHGPATRLVGQREFSLTLCDGRNMGPRLTEDYPGGQGNDSNLDWSDCDYAVIKNLRWRVVLCAPRYDETYIYTQNLVTDLDNDDGQPTDYVGYPRYDGAEHLQELLDQMVASSSETVGADVWHSSHEAIMSPYSCTLMRCATSQPQETELDVTFLDDALQRTRLLNAPVGMLRGEEVDDLLQFWADWTAAQNSNFLIPWMPGDTAGDLNQNAFNDPRMYRAWEPYDSSGFMLDRQYQYVRHWVNGLAGVNQGWAFDDELLDGYESLGLGAAGRAASAPMTFEFKGNHPGEIVISKRNPNPLVLHFSSLPIRLFGSIAAVTGTETSYFARSLIIPISWNVTCELKTG